MKHCILRKNRHKFNELTARGLHYRGLQNRKDTIITVKKPWIANKRLDLIITVPVSVLEKDCPFSAAFRYNDIVTWCTISMIFSYSKRYTGDSLIASVTKHTFWATWRRDWRLFIHVFKLNGKKLSWLLFHCREKCLFGNSVRPAGLLLQRIFYGAMVQLMQVSHLKKVSPHNQNGIGLTWNFHLSQEWFRLIWHLPSKTIIKINKKEAFNTECLNRSSHFL